MPLRCLGLIGIVWALWPGKDFYGGRTATLSLIFQHGAEIVVGLLWTMLISAGASLVILIWQWFRRDISQGESLLPETINLALLIVFFLLTRLIGGYAMPITFRRVTEVLPSHTYYLEAQSCIWGIIDCPTDAFLSQRYVVIDCPRGGLTCAVVFISNPKGYRSGDPFPSGPYALPEMRRVSTDQLQMIEGERILWDSSQPQGD